MTLKLSMVCGRYDRNQALLDGTVTPRDIELDITVNSDDMSRQALISEGAFDVAECFTGQYLRDLPTKKLGVTAIPIFVKRMFRHSYIYVNTRAGVADPTDLN